MAFAGGVGAVAGKRGCVRILVEKIVWGFSRSLEMISEPLEQKVFARTSKGGNHLVHQKTDKCWRLSLAALQR